MPDNQKLPLKGMHVLQIIFIIKGGEYCWHKYKHMENAAGMSRHRSTLALQAAECCKAYVTHRPV